MLHKPNDKQRKAITTLTIKCFAGSTGIRTVAVEKIKMTGKHADIAKYRYEIQNKDGSIRKMWSTFIFVGDNTTLKISAIWNMLPSG